MKPAPPVMQMLEVMIDSPLDDGTGRTPTPLGPAFYQRPTIEVARDLLGKIVVSETGGSRTAVRLTEVEAYLGPDDPACHTFGGRRTLRVRSMWGPAGHAYVYFIYGMYHCLNVVTVGGAGEAVLLRGGAVVEGADLIRRRRGPGPPDRALVDGPGKLCIGLGVDRRHDDRDLSDPSGGLWIGEDGFEIPATSIATAPRIGLGPIGDAAHRPLRWYLLP